MTLPNTNHQIYPLVYNPLIGVIDPLDSYQPTSGTAYVNISPDDFERIRLIVREELDEALATLVKGIGMIGRLQQE